MIQKRKERNLFCPAPVKPIDVRKRKKSSNKIWATKESKDEELLSDLLNYENLTAGQVTLGCIAQITEFEIKISLPHRLVGSVHITEIFKSYTKLLKKLSQGRSTGETIYKLRELYSVGNYLAVNVKSPGISPDWHVSLSLNPSRVNYGLRGVTLSEGAVVQCAVQSVEDKGYVLFTGIPGVRGAFMRNMDYKGSAKFGIGSVFLGTVKSIKLLEDETKGEPSVKINFSYHVQEVAAIPALITETTTAASIIPGTICTAQITKICTNGVRIKVANFEGFVYRRHFKSPLSQLEDYEIGQFVEARLLYKTILTRKAFFTFNLSMEVRRDMEQYDVLETEVYGSTRSGFFVALPNENIGYCSKENIEDGPSDGNLIPVNFPIDKKVKCCIKFFHYMDRIYLVSTLREDLMKSENSCDDLTPGQMVSFEVTKLKQSGIEGKIGTKFWGFISKGHATETAMDDFKSRVKIGKTLNAKVLSLSGKRALLTLKKSLINSKLPIVSSLDSELVGKAVLGTIFRIGELGIRVKFYNNVGGFLHRNKLSAEEGENLFKFFKEGQVLKSYVKSVDLEKGKIFLTSSTNPEGKVERIPLNRPVDCIVKSIDKGKITVEISGMKKTGVISMHNLSDDLGLSKAIFERLHDGDKIKNVFILSTKKGQITLTMKPNTCRWLSHLPGKHTLTEGEILPVTVASVMNEFLIVAITQGRKISILKSECELSALKANSQVAESFKNFDIKRGQSIIAKVKDLKGSDGTGSNRASINFSDVLEGKSRTSTQIVLDFISSEFILRKLFKRSGGILRAFAEINQGDQLLGKVIAKTTHGLLVLLDVPGIDEGGIEGVITCKDPLYKRKGIGSKILTTVVHCDFVNKILLLISTREKSSNKIVEKSKFQMGSRVNCEIVLTNKEFSVAILPSENNGDRFIYLPSKRHYNDLSYRHLYFDIGKIYEVIIRFSKNGLNVGELSCDATEGKFHLKQFSNDVNLVDINDEDSCKICLYGSKNLAPEARVKLEKVLQINSAFTVKNIYRHLPHYSTLDDVPQFTSIYYLNRVYNQRADNAKLKKIGEFEGNEQKSIKRKLSDGEDVIVKKTKLLKKNKKEERDKVFESMEESDDEEYSENDAKIKKIKKKRKISEASEEEEINPIKSKVKDTPNSNKKLKKGNSLDVSLDGEALKLETKGFCWDDDIWKDVVKNYDSSSGEEEDENKLKEKTKKFNKAELSQKSAEEEERLYQSELVRLQKDRVPESVMDYEALTTLSPNSSAVWIQFISFHLQNAEIEKAKAIAVRALETIPINEEQERISVWTVRLRLEVLYGDEESLKILFHEALTSNDQKKIYNAMALIYGESDKIKEAEGLYRKMCKKYGKDPDVWLSAILFMFKYNNGKQARDLLDRSLLSLEKEDHVNLIHRFAQLEFQQGDPEKGKTIYESLVGNYPKRLDIWGVYVDMLTKNKEISAARRVLDRMTMLKLRLPKMRSIFKRLLQFEQQHGNETSVEEVKHRVQEYIQGIMGE